MLPLFSPFTHSLFAFLTFLEYYSMHCDANQLSITKNIGTAIPQKVLSRHHLLIHQSAQKSEKNKHVKEQKYMEYAGFSSGLILFKKW